MLKRCPFFFVPAAMVTFAVPPLTPGVLRVVEAATEEEGGGADHVTVPEVNRDGLGASEETEEEEFLVPRPGPWDEARKGEEEKGKEEESAKGEEKDEEGEKDKEEGKEEQPEEETAAPRRSERSRQPPDRYSP